MMAYSEEQATTELAQLEEELTLVKHPVTIDAIEYAINQRKYYLTDSQLQSVLSKKEQK
jgi:hypothetical protein